jgi:hypothetical protein
MSAACVTAAPEPPRPPVTVSFERGPQGHIIVPVRIRDVHGYAVLDNGASATVIDRSFAEKEDLTHWPMVRFLMRTIRGGFEFGQAAKLSIGAVEEKITPLVLDVQLLSHAAGRKVVGIVGEEFFERHVVEVDFTNSTLTLHDRRTFVPPADLEPLKLKSKSTAKTRIPATIEKEDGHEITFDLGSEGYALIDEGKLADRMMADGRPSIPNISGIVRNGEFRRHDGRTMTSKEITFGGFALSDVPTDIAAKGFVSPSDISLGVNALSRFDLIFDVGGKRMWMRPNASYGEPFPHPVIGVNFSTRSQPGALQVVGVGENTPAERSGLRRGDVVAKVDGEEATIDRFAAVKAGDVILLELADGTTRRIEAARFY